MVGFPQKRPLKFAGDFIRCFNGGYLFPRKRLKRRERIVPRFIKETPFRYRLLPVGGHRVLGTGSRDSAANRPETPGPRG